MEEQQKLVKRFLSRFAGKTILLQGKIKSTEVGEEVQTVADRDWRLDCVRDTCFVCVRLISTAHAAAEKTR